jgi:hypothetical protein
MTGCQLPNDLPAVENNVITFYSGTMAVTLCLLGWMGFLRVKMFYGNYKINKLTFQPFKWAAFALSCKFIGQILYLIF